MINILFWNTRLGLEKHKTEERIGAINDKIIEIILEDDIDVAIFAEYELDLQGLCNKLYLVKRNFKIALLSDNTRVKMIYSSRFVVEPIRDSKYYFINLIKSTSIKFLISGVHLQSNMKSGNSEREVVAGQFMLALNEAQEETDNKKCVITGDFNANPFEDVMLKVNCFNSLPYADLVEKKRKRGAFETDYQMFYNPMWNFLGDLKIPNSTYHYDSGGAIDFYKNIYDQVIVSAEIVDKLDKKKVKIITETSTGKLLGKNESPDKQKYSDHLPIIFSIKEDI